MLATTDNTYTMRLKLHLKSEFGFFPQHSFLGLRKIVRSYSIGKPRGERRTNCPICHEAASQLQYKHKEFRNMKVRVCAKCGHGYADRDFTIKHISLWSTNRERADYYVNEIIPTWVTNPQDRKFLEIGSCDFYLLSKLRALYPRLLLYAYDKYPKRAPPNYITFISTLRDITQVDYVLMIHTLEHVYELDTFLMELGERLTKNAVVIIEVPNNSIMKHHEVQSGKHITGYHFHFFNESSLKQILLRHDFQPLMICSYGPSKWELNGINLLGIFQHSKHKNKSDQVRRPEFDKSDLPNN